MKKFTKGRSTLPYFELFYSCPSLQGIPYVGYCFFLGECVCTFEPPFFHCYQTATSECKVFLFAFAQYLGCFQSTEEHPYTCLNIWMYGCLKSLLCHRRLNTFNHGLDVTPTVFQRSKHTFFTSNQLALGEVWSLGEQNNDGPIQILILVKAK